MDRSILIKKRFDEIQEMINSRPVLGAKKWYLSRVVYINDSIYELDVEDGHIGIKVIVKYNTDTDTFRIEKEV